MPQQGKESATRKRNGVTISLSDREMEIINKMIEGIKEKFGMNLGPTKIVKTLVTEQALTKRAKEYGLKLNLKKERSELAQNK